VYVLHPPFNTCEHHATFSIAHSAPACTIVAQYYTAEMQAQITQEHIEAKLREGLSASFVRAVDESDGCGAKFRVCVVSAAFEGQGLLQRHRSVNALLRDELTHIHALQLKTYTPEQFEKLPGTLLAHDRACGAGDGDGNARLLACRALA
jgi:stress-induced morphogen